MLPGRGSPEEILRVARRWVAVRIPELTIVLLGVVLRIMLAWRYDVRQGYDFWEHALYVRWFKTHLVALPPGELTREAYHPPLFYLLGGLLLRMGGSWRSVQLIAIGAGVLRLLLLWFGLERHLARYRLARLVALALAAVMPASIQIDAMVYPESVANLFMLVGILLMLELFRADGRARWGLAVALGVTIGLGLLTKLSALMLLVAATIGALMEFVRSSDPARVRIRRLLPLVAGFGVLLAVAGWYYARNVSLHGRPFISGYEYDVKTSLPFQRLFGNKPYLDRRTLGFFVGWSNSIFEYPYYPSARSRFLPVLIASTFVDYYNYGYDWPKKGAPVITVNERPISAAVMIPSRLSVAGGVVIALTTLIAWWLIVRNLWSQRDLGPLTAFLVPLLVVVGQLHYATAYPFDWQGVVKGVYAHCGSPPLYAAFGLAVAWLWQRRRLRPLALANLAALAAVASYTFYCRVL